MTRAHHQPRGRPAHATALSVAAIALLISTCASLGALGQSTKGGGSSAANSNSNSISQRPISQLNSYSSPSAQLRQQQQQQQQQQPTSVTTAGTKRRVAPQQQQQQQPQIQQQQIPAGGYQQARDEQQVPIQQQQISSSSTGARERAQQATTTEDPLADSEPALYGSVAGQPGVDFPAYTRIPKTSFSCEGKGFDFGFYADEEAQCQVYHVCWSGRRESFLCGVGTVFNQAILACDYWHSVDCSKSSQFYSVNSELGKAGAEPAAGGSQQIQRQRNSITPASLPSPSSSSSLANPNGLVNNVAISQSQYNIDQVQEQLPVTGSSVNFGEPLNQRRVQQQQQQQQQQQYANDESIFDAPQQPIVQQSSPSAISTGGPSYSQRPNQIQQQQQFDTAQQRVVEPNLVGSTKGAARSQAPSVVATTTLATPPAAKRPRFNLDFNQKVNSLIESPVRAPLKTATSAPSLARNYDNNNNNNNNSGSGKRRQVSASAAPPPRAAQQPAAQTKSAAPATTRRPLQQQQVAQQNFAQLAVARAQQKSAVGQVAPARSSKTSQQVVRQQEQQQFDSDLDEPRQEQQQQQQQQQTFDDSPVQTSTAANIVQQRQEQQQLTSDNSYNQQPQQQQQLGNQNGFIPQQQQLVVRAGGNSLDGSSAITTQYDTILPASGGNGNSPVANNQQAQVQGPFQGDASPDSSYESALDDSRADANDGFRSSGAKAAASHNQNWYIMRTI